MNSNNNFGVRLHRSSSGMTLQHLKNVFIAPHFTRIFESYISSNILYYFSDDIKPYPRCRFQLVPLKHFMQFCIECIQKSLAVLLDHYLNKEVWLYRVTYL